MGDRANYSGLIVAGIGFFLTRFTVTLSLYENPLQFYLAGVAPLTMGLGLAAFGVALTVADVEPAYVRTTAVWCVIGVGAMLVLVVLTLLGSSPGGLPDVATVRSQAYLSNFLIGGSVGGTLTGLYAAGNRRHRTATQHQANRLQVLNRLLRHEVLNAVTVIRGYAGTTTEDTTRTTAIIENHASGIERTIEEIRYLAQRPRRSVSERPVIALGACIEASVVTVTENHPDATVSLGTYPSDLRVIATARLEQVIAHLLENAIVHAGDPTPDIMVSTSVTNARISVSDTGPGLSHHQQRLLESGAIQEFDDPGTGFGLNLVRLYVEDFGGAIEVDSGSDGSTITIVLPRAVSDDAHRPLPTRVAGVRPALPQLFVILGASLLAGVVFGLTSEWLGGSVAGIGVFYGAVSPFVGWFTHEFHSVVFGFVFAGFLSVAPARYRTHIAGHVVIGIAWGFVLWVVAAGIIAPVWLQLLGVPATIPNLTGPSLLSHLAWGLALGVLTFAGYKYITPWASRTVAHRRTTAPPIGSEE